MTNLSEPLREELVGGKTVIFSMGSSVSFIGYVN